jgi:magnesium chelatase family protein
MPSRVYSAAVVGVEAFEVEIEVHAGWGNTDKIAVVGLPDTAVKESKDRVTSAISNSGLRWPYGQRSTINLAPADVRKEGPSFDMPLSAKSSISAASDSGVFIRPGSPCRSLATDHSPS